MQLAPGQSQAPDFCMRVASTPGGEPLAMCLTSVDEVRRILAPTEEIR